MKKALVVWGGWNGHTPKESVQVFIPWLREQGFEVDVSETLDVCGEAGGMSRYDLIVPCVTGSKAR